MLSNHACPEVKNRLIKNLNKTPSTGIAYWRLLVGGSKNVNFLKNQLLQYGKGGRNL